MELNIRHKIKFLFICNLVLCVTLVVDVRASESKNTYRRKPWMFDKQLLQMYEGTLRSRGYDVNDVEDIKRAAIEGKKPLTRDNALVLLAYKSGTKAIPVLKEALKDTSTYYEKRCMAATLLGMFGDKSGLDKMRKDMAEFSKDDETLEKERKDGKINPEYEQDLKKKYSLRLRYALLAANVLADFGDCSGYELAARQAIESESGQVRNEANRALVSMLKFSGTELKAKGLFPEDVLLAAAEKETDSRILYFLNSYLSSISSKDILSDKLLKVQDKIANSPHLSEKHREHIERVIRGRERKRQYLEMMKKKKNPNESEDANKKK
jgi:hypothetical protein